jgi:hypothetical protein
MKKFILIIVGILFLTWLIYFVSKNNRFPFTKDFASTPESSQYSIENKLLFKKYKLPQDSIKFGNDYYIISDAWSTYKFTDKSNSKIRENVIVIIIKLSSAIKNKTFSLIDLTSNNQKALKINLTNVMIGKNIEKFGISDNLFTVHIRKDELIGSLDTLELITNDGIHEKKIFLTSY